MNQEKVPQITDSGTSLPIEETDLSASHHRRFSSRPLQHHAQIQAPMCFLLVRNYSY